MTDFDYGLANHAIRITSDRSDCVFLWFWPQMTAIRDRIIAAAKQDMWEARREPRGQVFCGERQGKQCDLSIDQLRTWKGLVRVRFDDLKGKTEGFLQHHFGKAGSYYYWAARGIDERPVRADRIRKSVGAENTFPVDLFTYEAARDALREIVDNVWRYCEGSGIRGRTVTLKVKFANFQQITRSRIGQMQIRTRSELEQLSNALLEPLFPVARGVRLLGVSLSSLAEESEGQPEFRLPV